MYKAAYTTMKAQAAALVLAASVSVGEWRVWEPGAAGEGWLPLPTCYLCGGQVLESPSYPCDHHFYA